MKIKGIKIPYYVKIILVIILDIWLIWSHHAILYNTYTKRFEISASDINNTNIQECSTFGKQWPCNYKKDFINTKFELTNCTCMSSFLFSHQTIDYSKHKISLRNSGILCDSVCVFGRISVVPMIIVTNFIYLTTDNFRQNSKHKKILKYIGWVMSGLIIIGALLSGNIALFVRSLPAYLIIILLQLDLYAEQ